MRIRNFILFFSKPYGVIGKEGREALMVDSELKWRETKWKGTKTPLSLDDEFL